MSHYFRDAIYHLEKRNISLRERKCRSLGRKHSPKALKQWSFLTHCFFSIVLRFTYCISCWRPFYSYVSCRIKPKYLRLKFMAMYILVPDWIFSILRPMFGTQCALYKDLLCGLCFPGCLWSELLLPAPVSSTQGAKHTAMRQTPPTGEHTINPSVPFNFRWSIFGYLGICHIKICAVGKVWRKR